MVQQASIQQITIYYNKATSNKSFVDMYNYLRATGRKNCKFFLATYDPDLLGVDPRDPMLSPTMKAKILKECVINFWYFIREVVRIPVQGKANGIQYELHRGNLALNYLFTLNYNVFLELPRQHGKTTAALVRYLWVYNFGTSNSEIMFVNKKHDDSKRALETLKQYRDALPSYLQMSEPINREGKKIKVTNTAQTMKHPINNNIIRTAPGARTKQLANNLGRGCTMPIQYYDEFAWTLYNKEIYMAAMPAFSTASKNAKENGAPYGVLITTTPGDLTTDEGQYALSMKDKATVWNEAYYDYTYDQMEELRMANKNSTFFYVRYTYQQLGRDENYFNKMVAELNRDWAVIRREVLLEWTTANMNCPFSTEDLDCIKSLCKPPIDTVLMGSIGQYQILIYDKVDLRNPPIIGVDVSGAQYQDSSALTIIDSKTTKVFATFSCNYISSPDFVRLIYDLVTKYMPNAIVNIERNGGFGLSILQNLCKTSIRKNIYYEYKEKVVEEVVNGSSMFKRKQMKREYGLNNTPKVREQLMELLFERVELHKDKFVAQILHDEMEKMEVKKNGKIEHSSNSHDDQVFSYLMALYVWYYGQNLKENFGIRKTSLQTDDDATEDFLPLEEQYSVQVDDITEETDPEIQQQIEYINSNKSISFADWSREEYEKDKEAERELLNNPLGLEAYMKASNLSKEDIDMNTNTAIPDSVFLGFYSDDSDVIDNNSNSWIGNLSDTMNSIGDYR